MYIIFSFYLVFKTNEFLSIDSSLKGYCAPYNGKICRKYLTGIGQVWFNDSNENTGGWLNEKITTSLWAELIERLIEPCRSAAEVLVPVPSILYLYFFSNPFLF